jgi:hypothetical protein
MARNKRSLKLTKSMLKTGFRSPVISRMWALGFFIMEMKGRHYNIQEGRYGDGFYRYSATNCWPLNTSGQSQVCVSLWSWTYFSFKLLSHSEILFCSNFRVLARANIKIITFWDVGPCSQVNGYHWRLVFSHEEIKPDMIILSEYCVQCP